MLIPETKETQLLGRKIGGKNPFFLLAGPCVIESEEMIFETAEKIVEVAKANDIFVIFKASFDKANRSDINSYRGVGIDAGLRILAEVKKKFHIPIISDIHEPSQIEQAAEVLDMIQIPAFLSRQTDLLVEAARSGLWVNVKKGQFMAPLDALKIIEKFQSCGSDKISICERGYTFGYNNLVVDMRSFEILRNHGAHVVFDATHSTQLPGGGIVSGGQREMAYPLARAAVATGLDGIFMEVHPDPPSAKSDATNQLYLKDLDQILKSLKKIDSVVKAE